MVPTLKNRNLLAHEPLTPHDQGAVLACASMLQQSMQAGTAQPLLRGKHIGLLCGGADPADAALFRQAVLELGARLAQIQSGLTLQSPREEVQHTARMLGWLYDAVECQGVAPPLVQQVGSQAGVPVYDGLASPGHPTARLAELMAGDASPADKRRFVLQAMLLSTID
ncbi:MAG TPA: ornithine carbamoyltransferase [Burkholderiaceae bacterium]|nr:ornithine carbamoyltransferase [Burkholderiaceae bacterium]